jgi:hypothetical protein
MPSTILHFDHWWKRETFVSDIIAWWVVWTAWLNQKLSRFKRERNRSKRRHCCISVEACSTGLPDKLHSPYSPSPPNFSLILLFVAKGTCKYKQLQINKRKCTGYIYWFYGSRRHSNNEASHLFSFVLRQNTVLGGLFLARDRLFIILNWHGWF